MGKPMLLHSLGMLSNASFEDDADGAAPSGWDTATYSISGLQEVDDAYACSAGAGLPSLKSLRQNVVSDTVGFRACAAQRVQLDDLRTVATANDTEIAACALVRYEDPRAVENAHVDLLQYAGTSMTVGEGSPVVSITERKFRVGLGPEWFMLVCAAKIEPTVNYFEIRLRYEIGDAANYDANAHAWFDRAAIGGLVDFDRSVSDLGMRSRSGFRYNLGDGVAEIVKIAHATNQITFDVPTVLEGTRLDYDLRSFMQMLAGDSPGHCALWIDRDKYTNSERCFQRLVPDPRTPRIEYPDGVVRRNYELRFIAPSEFTD